MPEGLGPIGERDAESRYDEHKELSEKQSSLRSDDDALIKAAEVASEVAEKYKEPPFDISPTRQKIVDAQNENYMARSANLWRAEKDVEERLPQYKQSAAEEMKRQTGKDFVPRTDDTGPVPDAGPAEAPESPDQQ